MLKPDIAKRIVRWNAKRNLITAQPTIVNFEVENLHLFEELVEFNFDAPSHVAREAAEYLYRMMNDHMSGYAPTTDAQKIDALCDINVYSYGTMAKMHYHPMQCMEQTLAEIESREGEIVDGKFIKDESEKAKSRWYTANYGVCKVSSWDLNHLINAPGYT